MDAEKVFVAKARLVALHGESIKAQGLQHVVLKWFSSAAVYPSDLLLISILPVLLMG